MLVDAELDTSTELDGTSRRSDLGCAQRKPKREARGADVSAGLSVEHYQSGNYVRGRPCLRTDKHQFHNAFLLPFPFLFFFPYSDWEQNHQINKEERGWSKQKANLSCNYFIYTLYKRKFRFTRSRLKHDQILKSYLHMCKIT
jgi:hypothetical protein